MSDWAYLSLVGAVNELIPQGKRPKTMAVFTMNNVTGLSALGPLVKAAKENGIDVVVNETYNVPLADATPLVSKAKMKKAEILACISAFDDGVMITRAAKAQNYNPKIEWQMLASRLPAWMKEFGQDGNNVLSHTYYAFDLPFAENKEITDGVKRKFGDRPVSDFLGLGYCWMKSLEVAVQGAGTLDNQKIRDYLRSRKFDLPYGKGIGFDARGLPSPFLLYRHHHRGPQQAGLAQGDGDDPSCVYPKPALGKVGEDGFSRRAHRGDGADRGRNRRPRRLDLPEPEHFSCFSDPNKQDKAHTLSATLRSLAKRARDQAGQAVERRGQHEDHRARRPDAPAMRGVERRHLRIDPKKTAVVTIDMHRGHLDPVEATLPVTVEESRSGLPGCGQDLLRFARASGMAVVHVIAVFRESEVDKDQPQDRCGQGRPFQVAPKTEPQRRGVPHNLQGSIQAQLMPELGPEPGDYVIDNKKTFSSFEGTGAGATPGVVLEVDTVVLMGINTNTCVLCAAFEAFNLGYKTVVISDCVASMYGRDLHMLGLENVARCLGWVLTVDELKEKVSGVKKD